MKFITAACQQVLEILKPWQHSSGKRNFPAGCSYNETYYSGTFRSDREWLQHCVDKAMDGRVDPCLLAENIALLAEIHWEHGGTLQKVSLQALVVTPSGTIQSLLSGAKLGTQYFRLDAHPRRTGKLFSEGFPHLHVSGRGEPRLQPGFSENVVTDFLELLYRNYRYDDWVSWAIDVWQAKFPGAGSPSDPLHPLLKAFDESKIGVLEVTYSAEIQHFRNMLRAEKDAAYPLRLSGSAARLLHYP